MRFTAGTTERSRVLRINDRRSAHAALAQDDVVVALGHDVLGGQQQLFERGGHAALQQDRLAGAAGALEQREVLHVPRADLDAVAVLFDELQRFVVDGFGDDGQVELFPDAGQDLQRTLSQSLNEYGESARLHAPPRNSWPPPRRMPSAIVRV